MSAVQTTKMSNFRWVICVLLFLATTVNYMDRLHHRSLLRILCHCQPLCW